MYANEECQIKLYMPSVLKGTCNKKFDVVHLFIFIFIALAIIIQRDRVRYNQ